jgi:hypothetical protein
VDGRGGGLGPQRADEHAQDGRGDGPRGAWTRCAGGGAASRASGRHAPRSCDRRGRGAATLGPRFHPRGRPPGVPRRALYRRRGHVPVPRASCRLLLARFHNFVVVAGTGHRRRCGVGEPRRSRGSPGEDLHHGRSGGGRAGSAHAGVSRATPLRQAGLGPGGACEHRRERAIPCDEPDRGFLRCDSDGGAHRRPVRGGGAQRPIRIHAVSSQRGGGNPPRLGRHAGSSWMAPGAKATLVAERGRHEPHRSSRGPLPVRGRRGRSRSTGRVRRLRPLGREGSPSRGPALPLPAHAGERRDAPAGTRLGTRGEGGDGCGRGRRGRPTAHEDRSGRRRADVSEHDHRPRRRIPAGRASLRLSHDRGGRRLRLPSDEREGPGRGRPPPC